MSSLATVLTSVEAGAIIGRHPVQVIRLIQAGQLRGEKKSGVWLLDPDDVHSYMTKQREGKK